MRAILFYFIVFVFWASLSQCLETSNRLCRQEKKVWKKGLGVFYETFAQHEFDSAICFVCFLLWLLFLDLCVILSFGHGSFLALSSAKGGLS